MVLLYALSFLILKIKLEKFKFISIIYSRAHLVVLTKLVMESHGVLWGLPSFVFIKVVNTH